MELDTNPLNRAIYTYQGSTSAYKINKCELQIALIDFQDTTHDMVLDMAETSGISWVYDDVFSTTRLVGPNETAFTVEVEKTCTLAQSVMTVSRKQDNVVNQGIANTSYSYPIFVNKKWNYRIGNDMFPYKKQITDTTDDYTITANAFEAEHGLNVTPTEFNVQNATYTCLLRTDDHINMSGIFLNANNKVSFEWDQGATGTGANYLWTTFLTHSKVLRCTADNARVSQ
jgi:hypothetical protein